MFSILGFEGCDIDRALWMFMPLLLAYYSLAWLVMIYNGRRARGGNGKTVE